MRGPIVPAKKISELQTDDPIAFSLVNTFLRLFSIKIGTAKELGLECAMEGLEELIDKGIAKIVLNEDESMNVAMWREDIGEWWMNGRIVELDDES